MGGQANDQRVVVATISTVFGIKGWVKVISHTQPADNAFKYQPWEVQINKQWQSLKVTDFKQHANGLIAHFEGCDDRDQARLYTGLDVYANKALMAPLEAGEYYWHDLEGLKVINQNGCLLGRVDHLLETGANDVLVIKACEGSLDHKERLVPYLVDQVIKKVDTVRGDILVDWDEDF